MDEVLNQLRRELAGRYEVEQELGHGGMAVVYLAKDLRHDRKVAIKVLRQDVGGASAERFLREIRTVAQLHHPHILQLLDSGTAGDHLFYVMPYVEGETIRQRLEREGPLPIDEAVRIAREAADALDYAHARGIVHRDIKPENIFLSAGHALVADFGIARAAESAAGTTLTDAGLAVGTPTYMSPEQATADPRVDGRSDQYALGCVVYELLAGQPPFTGPTSQAIMARHTTDPVPPLRTVRAVPPELESALVRALSKVPADRWPSTTSFAEGLDQSTGLGQNGRRAVAGGMRRRRLIATSFTLATVITGFMVWQKVQPSGIGSDAAATTPASIAVFPFEFSGDSAYAILATSIREGIITGLVRVPGMRVPDIDRRWASRPIDDPRDAGPEFGVGAVLTATIAVAGKTVRVSTRLVNVSDGLIRSQRNFDGQLSSPQDVFATQDSIVLQIVDALVPQLSPEQRQLAARGTGTRNEKAYKLFLDARAATRQRTPQSLDRAMQLLRDAIALDSNYVDAWLGLADALSWQPSFGAARPADVIIPWQKAIDRALALDSLSADAYYLRAFLRSSWEWDKRAAQRDYQRAIELAPSSAAIASDYAGLLSMLSEHDSAIAYGRRAVTLDPKSAFAWSQLGNRFAFAGLPDSALRAGEQAIALDSTYWPSYWLVMHGNLHVRRRAEADRAAARMARIAGEAPSALVLVAGYYQKTGDTTRAREMLDRIIAISKRQYVAPSTIGGARLAVGDREGALAGLEESVLNHDLVVHNDFMLSYGPLNGHPRYEAVKSKIFPDAPPSRHPFP